MIDLGEWETSAPVELPFATARVLSDSGFVGVAGAFDAPNSWRLNATHHVGVRSIGGITVRVNPKVPVGRILDLLGEHMGLAAWPADPVRYAEDDDLVAAVAGSLCSACEAVVRRGLLQGYRTTETAEFAVRGRIRFNAQLARRNALALPVELGYDEFTVDIVENGLLAGALHVVGSIRSLPPELRRRVRRLRRDLGDVSPERPGGNPSNPTLTRLNQHYDAAIRLSRLVLASSSIHEADGVVQGSGFSVDMNRLYEGVVGQRLRTQLQTHGGTVELQDRGALDDQGLIEFRPDLVWYRNGRPCAVVDLKYKRVADDGVAAPDVYQAVAYATRLELADCHLVYPQFPRHQALRVGDVTVHLHGVPIESSDAAADVVTRITAAIGWNVHLVAEGSR